MMRYMEGTTYVVAIDGAAMLRSVTSAERIASNHARLKDRIANFSAGWMGGTVSQIDTALTTGWDEGMRQVQAMVDGFADELPTPKCVRRKPCWGEDGDEASWEREAAGLTEVWRTSKRENRKGPVTVHLMTSWGGNSDRRTEELMWNGVVLAVLVDVLEKAGYRVAASLNGCSQHGGYGSSSLGRKYQLTHIVVKEPNMPLDLASMVPLVAHPGTFRWYGINATSLATWDVGSGHGMNISIESMPAVQLFNGGIKLRSVFSKHAAVQLVRETIAALITPNSTS